MSLILDALRKADHDRKTEADTPALEDIYLEGAAKSYSRGRWLLIGLPSLVLLVVLIGLFLFFNRSAQPESATEKTRVNAPVLNRSTTDPNASLAVGNPQKTEGRTLPEDKVIADNDITTSQSRLSASDLKKRLIQAQYKNTQPAAEVSITPDAVSALYKSQKNVDEPAKPSRIAPRTKNSAEATPENSLAHYADTPTIKELPLSLQGTIPTLMYSQHSYADNAEASIVINGKQLKVGARASGIRVENILSDGVILVLESENRSFKMAARSSWINY